mmetsp:Transcript_30179/g.95188  ORF Transcript_30179/g.95188 Transcript_30179/m.95188 type:complete len:321 (-) Transcript_30179:1041-2003(-)
MELLLLDPDGNLIVQDPLHAVQTVLALGRNVAHLLPGEGRAHLAGHVRHLLVVQLRKLLRDDQNGLVPALLADHREHPVDPAERGEGELGEGIADKLQEIVPSEELRFFDDLLPHVIFQSPGALAGSCAMCLVDDGGADYDITNDICSANGWSNSLDHGLHLFVREGLVNAVELAQHEEPHGEERDQEEAQQQPHVDDELVEDVVDPPDDRAEQPREHQHEHARNGGLGRHHLHLHGAPEHGRRYRETDGQDVLQALHAALQREGRLQSGCRLQNQRLEGAQLVHAVAQAKLEVVLTQRDNVVLAKACGHVERLLVLRPI